MTPLILAASAGRTQTVKILLNAGAEVNAVNEGGHSGLQYSASKGWKEVLFCSAKSKICLYTRIFDFYNRLIVDS